MDEPDGAFDVRSRRNVRHREHPTDLIFADAALVRPLGVTPIALPIRASES